MTTKTVADLVENIRTILAKNGFPGNRVALPMERLYESAHRDGLNFNKVLAELEILGIANEKNSEKIIFFERQQPGAEAFSMDRLKDMDFSNMSTDEMMRQASAMMQSMSPDQLKKIKDMYDSLSPEERANLLDMAKSLKK